MIRAFVAVALAPESVRRIAGCIEELAPRLSGVRWVPAQNLHVTLKFLGWIDERRLAPLANALADALEDFSRFSVNAKGLGVFPGVKRARVLWVGLEGPDLGRLAERVETALEPLGFAREARSFTAHLTIGRWRDYTRAPGELQRELDRCAAREFGASIIEEVALFESVLHRDGPTYRILEVFPLSKTTAG